MGDDAREQLRRTLREAASQISGSPEEEAALLAAMEAEAARREALAIRDPAKWEAGRELDRAAGELTARLFARHIGDDAYDRELEALLGAADRETLEAAYRLRLTKAEAPGGRPGPTGA